MADSIQHVVCQGDPFNGLTLYGPFSDYDSALNWAEDNGEDTEWWIVRLQQPSQTTEAKKDE
jgi:hypothetical protein